MCHFAMTQSRVFNTQAQELIEGKDSISSIETETPSTEQYDFFNEGSDQLNTLFLSKAKSISRTRPDELQVSQTLMLLAGLATSTWKGSQYVDSKKWKGLSKHFKRAFNRSTSKFNFTNEISFRINLVDNHGKRFYCDKKPGLVDHNLYAGKKPTGLTKEEKEELPDPIPLQFFSELELVDQFVQQLKRQKIYRDLKGGRYACVGINVEIDERTLNKNRIPTARVVIIFGARRLRDLRIKTPPQIE